MQEIEQGLNFLVNFTGVLWALASVGCFILALFVLKKERRNNSTSWKGEQLTNDTGHGHITSSVLPIHAADTQISSEYTVIGEHLTIGGSRTGDFAVQLGFLHSAIRRLAHRFLKLLFVPLQVVTIYLYWLSAVSTDLFDLMLSIYCMGTAQFLTVVSFYSRNSVKVRSIVKQSDGLLCFTYRNRSEPIQFAPRESKFELVYDKDWRFFDYLFPLSRLVRPDIYLDLKGGPVDVEIFSFSPIQMAISTRFSELEKFCNELNEWLEQERVGVDEINDCVGQE
jgi:hypothetical protein